MSTAFLVWLTYQQYQIARDTLWIANRAYVVPLASLWSREIQPAAGDTAPTILMKKDQEVALRPGVTPIVQIKFLNTGNTPARATTGILRVAYVRGLPGDASELRRRRAERLDDLYPSNATLAKDVDSMLTLQESAPQPLTADEVRAMHERRLTLVGWGKAEYRDVFGVLHSEPFCFFLNPAGGMGYCPANWN